MKDENDRKKVVAAVIAVIIIVLVAWFLSIRHEIDVEVDGEGKVSPDGATVGHLGSVTLEFIPAEGWELKEVLLDGSPAELTDGKLVLKWVVSNHHVKAIFAEEAKGTYDLFVGSDGQGSVRPQGTTPYPVGTMVSVVATPDDGYVIDDVKVDGESVGSRNVVKVTMDSDHSVEVVFREASDDPADPWVDISVDVQIITTGADFGTVEPSGKVRVACGGSLTVMLTLNEGYALVSVEVDGKPYGASNEFTVEDITADVSIEITVAHEASRTFTVTASATSGGSISPSGTISVIEGRDLTFTISPNSGYRLSSLEVDGKSVGTGIGSYTLKSIVADHTVRAVFSPTPSPGPGPGPTPVTGGFEAFVERVYGTRTGSAGSIESFTEIVNASLSAGDPFQLANIQPGVHQTADIVLKNKTESKLNVKLELTELEGSEGWEDLAKEIRVDIVAGSISVSETLYELISSPGWSSDVLTIDAGSSEGMGMTVSLPEDAGSGSMGKSLRFRLTVEAYTE